LNCTTVPSNAATSSFLTQLAYAWCPNLRALPLTPLADFRRVPEARYRSVLQNTDLEEAVRHLGNFGYVLEKASRRALARRR